MSISKPASERVREVLRGLKERDGIDFTNKNDYAPKLKQIAKDQNCSYSVCYDQMKKIGKEKGYNVGQDYKKEKTKKDKSHEFKFSAKKMPHDENKMLKQKVALEAKKKSIETEIAMQNMIIKSDAFEMLTTSNNFVLLMFRELVSGFGVKVAEEKKYEMMAKMMAVEEMRGGLNIPSWISSAMLVIGVVALFTLPALPQIRAWLTEDKEEKEKKSEKPLDEINNQEKKNEQEKKPDEKKIEG